MEHRLDLQQHSHRRRNPLTGEWILVSPRRTGRPWQGQLETIGTAAVADHDPGCHLCPGNVRAGGLANPAYAATYVFDNDFAALRAEAASGPYEGEALLEARPESGVCRVICYSPRHGDTLGAMSSGAIRSVVDTWAEQYSELGASPLINSVTIFENRGAMMGASSPHPHGQVWANSSVPNELVKESTAQLDYRRRRGGCLLCDYLAVELIRAERLVSVNDAFVALVPFWANWPFETLVLPRQHHGALDSLDSTGRDQLAAVLKDLTLRYDSLFGVTFPYSMGLHQRPTDGSEHAHWHWHGHYYPPLLRSATVRKFMVGYEMLAEPQRDITPEEAAQRLRDAAPRPADEAVGSRGRRQ